MELVDKVEMRSIFTEFKKEIRDFLLELEEVNVFENYESEQLRRSNMLKNVIETEIRNCHYEYFDLLEVASGQVNTDHLKAHLAKIGYKGDVDDTSLVEAAREVCKPTLDQTAQLKADLMLRMV